MVIAAFTAFFILLFPAGYTAVFKRVKKVQWLDPVVACYLGGIAVANQPFFEPHAEVATSITEGTVILAIPLLLFPTHFGAWLKEAPRAVLSFVLAVVAILLSVTVATWVLGDSVERAPDLAGMLVGIYTGGTPNMSAIALALDVPQPLFLITNAAEMFLGAIYLVFLMTAAQRVLGRFLPPYPDRAKDDRGQKAASSMPAHSQKPTLRQAAMGVALSVLVAGTTVALVFAVTSKLQVAPLILGITTLALAFSFVPRIRSLPGTVTLGNYLLMCFAVAVGSMAKISQLVEALGSVFAFVTLVLVLGLAIHYTLAALFRIDRDTVIITSTAALFGPPFVGPVAAALKNQDVVVSGVTTGVIGYAIGNYLGIAMAHLLS